LNDEAHAKLLDKLAGNNFANATPEIKEEILHFFAEPDAPYATKRNAKAWTKVQVQLQQLKSTAATPTSSNSAERVTPQSQATP
jgi:hypothetical protein